jgi:hypothetical protein
MPCLDVGQDVGQIVEECRTASYCCAAFTLRQGSNYLVLFIVTFHVYFIPFDSMTIND